MKKSLKAALLSALVFPGMGQIMLKCYKRGAVILAVVLASLYMTMSRLWQHAMSVAEKLHLEGGTIDIAAVSDAMNQTSDISADGMLSFATWLLLACWVGAIIDAWMLGKKQETNEIIE